MQSATFSLQFCWISPELEQLYNNTPSMCSTILTSAKIIWMVQNLKTIMLVL